ncbi:hypothetical protein PV327_007657 [Microctonus hyperodae]|uniref:1-phosphatidylinositol 4,5-bisphosphate phosphodiesterase n=1 Tax=Microctonus hyperodae TaxID=165561 RepID=A0AA39FZN4_MICHY|nr:hypothetical protein PV327_007657 [Microctonus hyperodae]
MANNKQPSINVSQTQPVEVSQQLKDGEKFIKWDEDSAVATPVTLRVDENGFYLYWVAQNNEIDMLDIAIIRDTRTGKGAKIPKDPRLKSLVTMGSQGSLEDKTMTIYYGSDFVNITTINFCTTKAEIAQHWTDQLFQLAYNLIQLNSSTIMFLQKAHTKLVLGADKSGNLPVKNILKMFPSNKDDRKRVEKALEVSSLPSGKNDSISLDNFKFENFFNLYKALVQRTEVEKVFDEFIGNNKKRLMTVAQLVDFLNKSQRDPRLNEILHPYANASRATDIIHQYEPNKSNANKGLLSSDGFLRYLMSEDNPIVAVSKYELSDDMDQPLAHYFINSSHNTYLTGHQLTGRSSVEMYRQCLLAGCRCVELDFWNGKMDEPTIVHGYTFVPELSARDVIEAIAESAFKTSEFPVVLSFENHCNPRQQAKIAQYCREYFGDMLLDAPLESHKIEPGQNLPPPNFLKRKIIIKNKKKHRNHKKEHKKRKQINQDVAEVTQLNESDDGTNLTLTKGENGPPPDIIPQNEVVDGIVACDENQPLGNGDVSHPPSMMLQQRQGSRESAQDEDDDDDESTTEEEESNAEDIKIQMDNAKVPATDKAAKETEAGAEISALVNYVQPVHFSSFEAAEKKNRGYEMSSFDEKQATTLLKEFPLEFVKYNKYQLSRVYPAGTRFDSSNFMPQVFWNAGCQLVALNYQTLDLAMQLNIGIFEYNQRSGYLLKPEFMRRKDRRLDPFAESTVDGIIAGTVHIQVISGQFLTDKRVGTYVEVDMYGLPADTVRKKFRTRMVPNNGINPIYDEETFVFKKVVLPELASIRIAAYEESGRLIGHRVLPVVGLCPGYRHVTLRNECGQPRPLASLFLHIVVKDYVPDGFSDFAEALANPIKYQSELEKRAKQLECLIDLDPNSEAVIEEQYKDNKDNDKDLDDKEKEKDDDIEEKEKGGENEEEKEEEKDNENERKTENDKDKDKDENFAGTSTSKRNPSEDFPVLLGATSPIGMRSAFCLNMPESPDQDDFITPLGKDFGKMTKIGENIIPETLDQLMEYKAAREKNSELAKKLELLRRKHAKEQVRAQSANGSIDGEKNKAKSFTRKLVKRLSRKNIFSSDSSSSTLKSVETPESEGVDDALRELPRSQSERLLNICKEHVLEERDLQEKYHDIVFETVQKIMETSQSKQLSNLEGIYDKETAHVLRVLQDMRQRDVKRLAKRRKKKAELERLKREVGTVYVDRGVNECHRLTEIYEKRKKELQIQHEEIRKKFAEEKAKRKNELDAEYTSRYNKFDKSELSTSASGGGTSFTEYTETTHL